mmetsp:Transcript_70273/g.206111  ORF Transcript_70273/g.206111 Transcript_70273/m.206111 type:complete len:205 (+) Transcript_70273:3548-4162(+)
MVLRAPGRLLQPRSEDDHDTAALRLRSGSTRLGERLVRWQEAVVLPELPPEWLLGAGSLQLHGAGLGVVVPHAGDLVLRALRQGLPELRKGAGDLEEVSELASRTRSPAAGAAPGAAAGAGVCLHGGPRRGACRVPPTPAGAPGPAGGPRRRGRLGVLLLRAGGQHGPGRVTERLTEVPGNWGLLPRPHASPHRHPVSPSGPAS